MGTQSITHSKNFPLASEKDFKKHGRGATDEIFLSNKLLVVTAWFDNKRVLVISNFVGKNPVRQCMRFDRKIRKKVTVPQPAAVQLYNSCMGGVNKADMILALYRTKNRPRKWYQQIALSVSVLLMHYLFINKSEELTVI